MIAAVCLMVLPAAVTAEDVSISAQINPTVVPVGNEAVLTVVIKGKFRKSQAPELPALDDFYVYESGTSQSFNFVNGQFASSITYSYTLVPQKEGTFKIEPIKVVFEDKEYTAAPVTVEVVAAATSVAPPSRARGDLPGTSPADGDEKPQKDRSIFINAITDQDTVYVNQQVTWTLGYYSDGRVNLLGSPNYSPPIAEGFWVEDLPPQNKYYTTIHGRQFLVNEIKRAYFPTSPGVFEIGEARVGLIVDDFNSRDFDSFFRRPFRSMGGGNSQTLQTEKKKVVVLPLPAATKPKDFTGVVAQKLRLSMSADKQVAQVGEPVNVTIELNVTGNVKTIAAPPLAGTESFKVYESGSSSDVFKKDYVVTGRKMSEYVVIPKNQGKMTIPAVRLPYFDPLEKRYLIAQSLPLQLDVRPGTKEEGRKVVYAGGGDDFEVINKDIRFIHPVTSVTLTPPKYLYQNKLYGALHLLPVFVLAFSLVVEGRRKKYRRDVGFARAVRAWKEADKKLNAGQKHLQNGRVEEGYVLLSGAIDGYFADKMNVSSSGFTADAVDDFLCGRGVDEDTRRAVRGAFAECDRARYASATVSSDGAEEILKNLRKTLKRLEKEYLG